MLIFDAEKHEYRWSGVAVPSVTQVIKTMPLWREHGGADSEYHMSVGTAVHAVIAGTTALCDYGDRDAETIKPYLDSWRRGVDAFGIVVHHFELREFSRKHRYAGTIDAIGSVSGDGTVIDLKTGSPADWHPLQTAAYAAMGGWSKRCCVYLDPDGGLPKIKWHDNPGDFTAFAGWLNYARWAGVIR